MRRAIGLALVLVTATLLGPVRAEAGAVPDSLDQRATREALMKWERYGEALNFEFVGRRSSFPAFEAARIESLFNVGCRAADASMALLPSGDGIVLESLDDATIAGLQRQMQGFHFTTEIGTGVYPDPEFFAGFARGRGDSVSIEFFSTLSATYQKGSDWPVYVRQETDESGCVEFGAGLLVGAYGRWLSFAARHPRRYSTHIQQELDRIVAALDPRQACGEDESVRRECREFARRFPATRGGARARDILGGLH